MLCVVCVLRSGQWQKVLIEIVGSKHHNILFSTQINIRSPRPIHVSTPAPPIPGSSSPGSAHSPCSTPRHRTPRRRWSPCSAPLTSPHASRTSSPPSRPICRCPGNQSFSECKKKCNDILTSLLFLTQAADLGARVRRKMTAGTNTHDLPQVLCVYHLFQEDTVDAPEKINRKDIIRNREKREPSQ